MRGSLQNRLIERGMPDVPVAKMGATKLMYTDRQAYTILSVSKETVQVPYNIKHPSGEYENAIATYPKYVVASRDKVTIVSGSAQDGSAEYEYETTWTHLETFIFHKPSCNYREESLKWSPELDRYVPTGRTNKNQTVLAIGYKNEYHDPSF